MSTVVVLGCADQALSYELRSQLAEVGEVEVAFVAESTSELTNAVLRFEPDVVFMHDLLGPQPVIDVIRDLGQRRPGTAALIVTADTSSESYIAALEAGARGVVPYPLSFEVIQSRLGAATEWALSMQRLISGDPSTDAGTGRANVIAFTGAKGGQGTTTLAVHMGLDVVREVKGHRVVLVDLDLEKGDVSSLLEVRYRTSVADLAKVADDLSVQTVLDAVVSHESGLHLLLTPQDVRDVEYVTPLAVRRIVAALRQHYDLVLLDLGSHTTPVQASAVEIADEVLVVTTPDVLALRTMRCNLDRWEALGVRKPDAVRVLLNKASRHDEVQPDTVRKLAQAPVVSVGVPAMFRKLEPSVNARDPLLMREQTWWKTLRAIGKEVGLVRMPQNQDLAADLVEAEPSLRGKQTRGRRGLGRLKARSDEGSVVIEQVGLLPTVILIAVFLWQVALVGVTFVWQGQAAGAASHAVQLGDRSDLGVQNAARDRVPKFFRDHLEVQGPGLLRQPGHVRVSMSVPLFAPGVFNHSWTITTERTVVVEPGPRD